MNKKEIIIATVLTIIIAFMELTVLPSILVININYFDITPIYFSLIFNFILIGIISFLILKFFCPSWNLGFKKKGLLKGLKKYGLVGFLAGIMSFVAFYIGLRPFDYEPSIWKVLVEGIIYYIGLAIIEELYVRGLLLNIIEKLCANKKNKTMIAIIISSVIFGLGHIFGTLSQPLIVIISNVIWTIGMGMYFGSIYKKTNNLWLPIILHFWINICALPYCFSSLSGYADISLYIILPIYLLLGIYSFYIIRKKDNL